MVNHFCPNWLFGLASDFKAVVFNVTHTVQRLRFTRIVKVLSTETSYPFYDIYINSTLLFISMSKRTERMRCPCALNWLPFLKGCNHKQQQQKQKAFNYLFWITILLLKNDFTSLAGEKRRQYKIVNLLFLRLQLILCYLNSVKLK